MKKFWLFTLALLWATAIFAIEKSQTIVVINGSKFYVHTVKAGETLYALSKIYQTGENVIVEYNPSAAAELKVDDRLKIPFVAELTDKLSDRKLQKLFDMHDVAKGETLYAISRRYSIPIQTIIDDNPNLDPIHLHLGERLLIRREKRSTEPAMRVQSEWEEYRDNLNSVAEAGTAYHIVHTGETFYAISQHFGITEEQLSTMNNGLQAADLKAGAIIKIPAKTTSSEAQSPDSVLINGVMVAAQDTLKTTRPDFRPLARTERLNVALLLPISVSEATNANYLEFYQGFLLGLDSIKQQGYSVHLDLYNTGRNVEKVRQIVQSEAFSKVNLIVGPVYEESLDPIIQFAEQKNIPVVSPLANLTKTNSDVLFQLSPAPNRKYNKIADLIDGSKKLTLIYAGSTDKEFEAEIREMLGSTDYTRCDYQYNHSGASSITPLLQNEADNVFIIMADNEVTVDRILASIASANTNIIARGATAPQFVVLGNTRWNRYNNIDRNTFYKDRVIFLSTYHAKRDAEVIKDFDSNYIRAFASLPTLYSYRGYDSAIIFCPAMFSDIQFDMVGKSYTPLQTTYDFGQEADALNHVNRTWTRVNYNNDYTITIE
ncbi:MAG: LysM peptidoglycan-binding domain-containing protein [Alistipes sp.]